MRSSWILGVGWATLVALSCGARTPFDDSEPGNAGSTTGSGNTTGANTSGSSTGVTTSGGTSGSGAGGSSITTGVTTGSGGSSVGTGVGSTSTTTGSTGMGGAGGRGATGGSGGLGMGGRGAGGNPLLGILPGIRPGPACTNCVDAQCNGTSACSSSPACLAGVSCYLSSCAMVPDQNAQLACATRCFNGNVTLLSTALQAVTCVYGPCGGPCQARGPGG